MARPSLLRPVLFHPIESPLSQRSEVFNAVRQFLVMGLVALVRGISLTLELPPKCELDRDRAALFYRVAREALANTAKHSKATTAELRLRQEGTSSEIRIHDDGCGFDQSLGSPEGHFGLRIMRDTISEAGRQPAGDVRPRTGNHCDRPVRAGDRICRHGRCPARCFRPGYRRRHG